MSIKSILPAGIVAMSAALMPAEASSDGSAVATNAERFSELVELVFNGGDIAAADTYFAPTLVDHAPWPGHTADLAGFKAGLAELRTSFPDLHMTVERTVAQDDLLAIHSKLSGSQLGEFMGHPPSGRTFAVEAIDIVRMTDGRIAEHWGVIDTAAMAEQLGL
jgi:steroid delta-isomerase-like uncharacterized protein